MNEQYDILGTMVRDYASIYWKETKEKTQQRKSKQVFYFSMEFLLGRLLVNNMQNLGIYHIARDGLQDLGINIHELEEKETDAGLGNGGLGRLAACLMDSLASCGYPGFGVSIRYEYGFFRQKIVNGRQVEVPDQWLSLGNVWEIRKPKHAVEVRFYGEIDRRQDEHGRIHFQLKNCEHVRCVPYDIPIIGYKNKITNTLRLWSAEPSSENLPRDKDFHSYLNETRELCHGLYPDDSTEKGKLLRLKQQYFFVSATLQSVLRNHARRNPDFENLPELYVFHLNDTHPILAIPELMRLLMDEYLYEWNDAWEITRRCFAYTNHTVMTEALERWPINFVQTLLPRIYLIIEEINRRFEKQVFEMTGNYDLARSMSIIKDQMIHMAPMAIVGSYSVNGVAQLHSDILKADIFNNYYTLFPEKFFNVTNGITHRRWLVFFNRHLTKLLTSLIGNTFISDASDLSKLVAHADDPSVQAAFLQVKQIRKDILAKYILAHNGIAVDVNSLFDVQVKRLHSYKRQLLNVFHIIYQYFKIKNEQNSDIKRTYIFAAKAAPSYRFAKNVIELINAVAAKVNNDAIVSKFMKVVFIENYDVSKAEIIMPAADISEQISTAGKEASGTGNMKMMLNGAITLGTLDGANVEIHELVKDENMILFGLRSEDVTRLYQEHRYNAYEIYRNDANIRRIIDSLKDGTFGPESAFDEIYNEIIYKNDEFFVLQDFNDYVKAQQTAAIWYQNQLQWAKKCLLNIAFAGKFSSDRTIRDYVENIWQLKEIVEYED
ncbi:glycogen phosphorylase [Holotrichia oblita]|nr:glycogen phosphorylase [Holotrichia oblita]